MFIRNKYLLDIFALITLFVLILCFFRPLFSPTTSIFATPDGSLSDIFHFNYPLKNLLSEALKHNALPIWTNLIGMGFPPIAEAEIGAFNAINMILFKFFPTPVGYNLGYITTFLLFAYGIYFVMRSFEISRSISFLCAYVFTFSGFHIVQIAHYNHLQTLSYVPFLFLFWKHTLDHPGSKQWLIIPFITSQMIFAGHYQYVFMSIVFLGLYTFFFRKEKKTIVVTFFNKKILTILLLTLGLTSIQILPSYEYFLASQRNTFIDLFPIHGNGLSPSHLLQFIYPYILGDIRIGTYDLLRYRTNFWEAFSYIGVIPIFFVMTSLLSTWKDGRTKKYWFIIIVLLLLAFEGNSPFHFLFAFPPLTWFRIHSRFISLVTFIFVILFGLSYDRFIRFINIKMPRRYVMLIQIFVALIIVIDVWRFAFLYNPIIPAGTLYKPPESAMFIKTYPSQLTYTLGVGRSWFSYFNTNGWKDIKGYIYLLNGLEPNINMLYDIPQIQVYSGFKLSKINVVDQYIQSNITQDQGTKTISLSGVGINLLRLSGTNFIISPLRISNPELSPVHTIKSPVPEINDVNIYQLSSPKSQYYLAHNINTITGIRELEMALSDPSWSKSHDAIIDTNSTLPRVENALNDHITAILNSETEKIFTYTSDKDGYFILSTYLYPGWQASLDGKEVSIHNGNIFAMAVLAPHGTHTIEFRFIPHSLYRGAIVSAVALLLYVIIIGSGYRKRA